MLWFKNKKRPEEILDEQYVASTPQLDPDWPIINITAELVGRTVLFRTAINRNVFSMGWITEVGNAKEGKIVNISNTGNLIKIDDCWYETRDTKKGNIYWVIVLEILETRPIRDYVRPKPMINFNYGYQPEDESGNLDRSNPPTGGSGCPSRISHMDKGGTLKKPTTRRPVNPPKGHRSKSHD
jgi:hypothetical protein